MSSTAVATYVHARDPISQAGVVAQLRMRPEIRVVDSAAEAAVGLGIIIAIFRNRESLDVDDASILKL